MLERITRLVIEAYRAELPAPSARKETPVFIDAEEVGLADAIKGLADSQPARPRSASASAASSAGGPTSVPEPPTPLTSPSAGLPAPTSAPISAAAAAVPRGRSPSPSCGPRAIARGCASSSSSSRARDFTGAIVACEDLLSRVLATGSVMLGGQPSPRDPVIVVTLLGLDGPRYMAFRSIARGSRVKREPTLREALECYLFVAEARRALNRAGKGEAGPGRVSP